MRQVILLFVLLASLSLSAQEDFQIVKGNCMPDLEGGSHRASGRHKLPAINKQWDATKTYKQLVILVEFADLSFAEAHDKAFYEKVFNIFDESAYEGKKRYGQGSVADYFRTQSGGKFNLQFDIVGPYKVTASAKSEEDKYKKAELKEATTLMVNDQTERDFSQYDWDGNGDIEQVIYILAGPSGNVTGNEGYQHPNTSAFGSVTTHDGKHISNYTSSTELWTIDSGMNCGIGTICHEFTHSLGLPDIYPANGSNKDYSVCDEWELMDGGNFTNYGWCPPNFSALEKMLLGWQQSTLLTEACTITGMKPVSEGGEVYQIKKSDTEYVLLENRQWGKWDAGLPGKGLAVFHVNYSASKWSGNCVNGTKDALGYEILHADGMDYNAWDDIITTDKLSTWAESPRMHNRHLSTSPYPYGEVNTIADWELSDISVDADGLVSFKYKGGAPSGIASPISSSHLSPLTTHYFDLQGRRIDAPLRGQLYIVRKGDGTTRKYLYQ